MTGIKRLSPRQSRKVNTLVKKECCNCENGNCILLDDGDTCVCPQLISYSLLCKWFRIAVLPLDMVDHNVSMEELRTMTKTTPTRLLGLADTLE